MAISVNPHSLRFGWLSWVDIRKLRIVTVTTARLILAASTSTAFVPGAHFKFTIYRGGGVASSQNDPIVIVPWNYFRCASLLVNRHRPPARTREPPPPIIIFIFLVD